MNKINCIEDVYESIGGFGLFQLFAMLSIVFPELPSGSLVALPVFVGDYPKSWTCTKPNGIIEYGKTSESICTCDGIWDGGNSTIVSEWNLVCDHVWVTDFITSVQMAGMLFGGIIGSQMADILGRKKSFYIVCLVMGVSASASGFANSPFLYAITRFFVGASISSYLTIGAFYPMEFLPQKWRTISGSVGPWGVGIMLLSLFAYYIRPWRELTWMLALPVALSFLSLPFLPESPRWLLQKGKVGEAKKVFDQIARWNGYSPVEESVVLGLAKSLETTEGKSQNRAGGCQLLGNPHLRLKMAIFMAFWFTVSFVSNGILFNVKNLGADRFISVALQGLLDSIAFPSASVANSWLGRRKALMSYMIINSLSLLGIVLMEINIGVPYDENWVIILSLIGRFASCGAWGAVKCFTSESFPTTMRSSAVGVATVAAAVGGILAPQMVFLGTYYRPIPYFVFAAVTVGCTGLSLLLTETGNKPLGEIVVK